MKCRPRVGVCAVFALSILIRADVVRPCSARRHRVSSISTPGVQSERSERCDHDVRGRSGATVEVSCSL